MRVVLQRVSEASVKIDNQHVSAINAGLLILLGVETEDSLEDVKWLVKKIAKIRIFSDSEGRMNKSITQVGGDAIVVSQFTLYAKTKKGNRPSYINAAPPEQAMKLYEEFKNYLSLVIGKPVQSGEFGKDMKVSLVNNGPVTIIIDTKQKE